MDDKLMRGFFFLLAELDEAGAEKDRIGYPLSIEFTLSLFLTRFQWGLGLKVMNRIES
jgi:hypothetical protein